MVRSGGSSGTCKPCTDKGNINIRTNVSWRGSLGGGIIEGGNICSNVRLLGGAGGHSVGPDYYLQATFCVRVFFLVLFLL